MLDSDWSDSFPILVVSSPVMLRNLCLLVTFCLHTRAKCPFLPQLLHNLFNAGKLCVGFQFGALQNLHGFSFVVLFFGLVLNLLYWFFFYFLFSVCDESSRYGIFPVFSFVGVLFDHFNCFSQFNLSRSFVSVIANCGRHFGE